MKSKSCFVVSALKITFALVLLLHTAPLNAVGWNLDDYYLSTSQSLSAQLPHTCIAGDPAQPGSFGRAYKPTASCYIVTKGASQQGQSVWGQVTLTKRSDGYLYIVRENGGVVAPSCNGKAPLTRFWKDYQTGTLGIKALKTSQGGDGYVTFTQNPFTQHYYTQTVCTLGQPECSDGPHFGTQLVEQGHLGYDWDFLFDCRSGRPCTAQTYPVEMIFEASTFGSWKEEYRYGRWQDPVAGYQWRGLGLISYSCTDINTGGPCCMEDRNHNGQCDPEEILQPGVNRYLVDCNSAGSCQSCP